MKISENSSIILNELNSVFNFINDEEVARFIGAIVSANRVFVTGAGRSLLMIRAFAMRLMHMGKVAYVIGETITPSIGPGDLLIVASGTGETDSLITMVKKSKQYGANVAALTIYPDSSLGDISDVIVSFPCPSPKRKNPGGVRSTQPGANLFEQALLLFTDAIVIMLWNDKTLEECNVQLMRLHANLE